MTVNDCSAIFLMDSGNQEIYHGLLFDKTLFNQLGSVSRDDII